MWTRAEINRNFKVFSWRYFLYSINPIVLDNIILHLDDVISGKLLMTSYQDKLYKKRQKYKTKSSYLKFRKLFRKLLVLETVLTFVQSLILTEINYKLLIPRFSSQQYYRLKISCCPGAKMLRWVPQTRYTLRPKK